MRGAAPPPLDRVLVVDDHRVFAEVLAEHLHRRAGVERVEVAHSLDQARVVLRRFEPQVVLLDYDMGGSTGTELLPELRTWRPPLAVVMLSAVTDPDAVIAALEAGADGWVGKDGRLDLLLGASTQVLAGDLYLSPPTLRAVLTRLLEDRAGGSARTFVDALSARELEVLRCLVAGMSRAEVAKRLFISPNTVRTHVQNLLGRADVHSTVALVAAARAAGVLPLEPERPGTRI